MRHNRRLPSCWAAGTHSEPISPELANTSMSRGIRPDWIIGASVGAITGAILAGNALEHRLAKLKEFWAEATQHTMGHQPKRDAAADL